MPLNEIGRILDIIFRSDNAAFQHMLSFSLAVLKDVIN